MKKLSEEIKKEFDLVQSEYFINQKQIKSQISIFIRQRNYALLFGILCLLVSVVVIFKCLMIAGEVKKVDKVVFKENGAGGITYMGIVNNGLKINFKKYIANQLEEYITALNSVPNSYDMKQYNVYKVQYMTDTKYYPILQSELRNLYTKNINNIVNIKITSIGEVAKGVWEIDWNQYINEALSGSWKSMVTFRQVNDKQEDTSVLEYNPLNIAITNIENNQRVEN